mmetsp:Transcript_503/g.1055  ORF Transcript_503/g.1055 Transcript_503/m.1055 type:complete len:228 (-) Transcript_503:339-1022(-)
MCAGRLGIGLKWYTGTFHCVGGRLYTSSTAGGRANAPPHGMSSYAGAIVTCTGGRRWWSSNVCFVLSSSRRIRFAISRGFSGVPGSNTMSFFSFTVPLVWLFSICSWTKAIIFWMPSTEMKSIKVSAFSLIFATPVSTMLPTTVDMVPPSGNTSWIFCSFAPIGKCFGWDAASATFLTAAASSASAVCTSPGESVLVWRSPGLATVPAPSSPASRGTESRSSSWSSL